MTLPTMQVYNEVSPSLSITVTVAVVCCPTDTPAVISATVSVKISEFSNIGSSTAVTVQQTWVIVSVNVRVLVGSTVRSIIWPGKQ